MKKRVLSLALAVLMAAALWPTAASAAPAGFTDISDAETARNVEVLRLMGIVEGDGSGAFHPNDNLTRAEFCKMVIEMIGKGGEIARYRSRTIFPDVRASHWAAGYVNYAVNYPEDERAEKLIHGMPDGAFAPDRSISFGEAAAILTRLLSYTDVDSGAVWPDGYVALAEASGVSKGLALSGASAITRGQAARMFVNLLGSDVKGGANEFAASLGVVGKETTLRAVDVSTGKLRTADGGEYEMVRPMASTLLVGLKGRVLQKGDKALTFLPTANTGGTPLSDAAIIVSADGSTAGFDGLTGGVTDYVIYKNGVRISPSALKRYDVATYSAASNAILVCDTRVDVYYEACDPSPSAPVTITVLKSTFSVLPTAQQSLSNFKPGQTMLLLLTADGKVAGALESDSNARSNAYAYVDGSGRVSVICAGAMLAISYTDAASAGKVGRISQSKNGVYISAQSGGAVRGAIDVKAGTLGTVRISDNALIVDHGKLTSLSELTKNVSADEISYVRTNSAGEADIVVISDAVPSGEVYGRALVSQTRNVDPETGKSTYSNRQIAIDCGANGQYGPYPSGYTIEHGTFVATRPSGSQPYYAFMEPLTRIGGVPSSAWVGKSAVVVGGRTYTVPESVICWNRDNQTWFDDLDAALAYGGTRDLYVRDGVVRAIEIRG